MKKMFLCSKKDEEAFIGKYCADTKDVVLATANYHYYMEKHGDEKEILFLEPDENTPYEDIWKIVDEINKVIKNCQLDNSLMYMLSYHHEHYMPRTLSTLILNLHMLDKLVKEYSIGHFFVVDDKESWKINEAIFLYAVSSNIACTIIDDTTGREKDCLFTLSESAYDKNSVKSKRYKSLELQEEKKIDSWMRQARKPMDAEEQKMHQIGALYCEKKCARQVRWMKQLLEILGEDTVVISFYESPDNEELENCGYTLYCLEDYFDERLFVSKYAVFKEDRDRILYDIEHNLSVKYKGIDLSNYLCRKTVNYFYRDVPNCIYMNSCAENYFSANHFGAISAWGVSNFWETRISYLNTRDYNTDFFYISRTGAVAWKNYEPWEDIISIRVFPKGYLAEQMTSKSFKGQVFFCFDILGGIDFYGKKNQLNSIYAVKDIEIAFLPSYPLEGIKTFRNYENNCKVIIKELSRRNIIINFKNHPGMYQYLDDEIRERYEDVQNFHFIDKSVSGDAVIQDSDLVITDGSLVIFDAACYQKPVFVMAAGSDYDLIKQHKEGFVICTTPEDLCHEILKLTEDKKSYGQKISKIIDKQNDYMEKLYGEYDPNAGQVVCQMIRDKIWRGGA